MAAQPLIYDPAVSPIVSVGTGIAAVDPDAAAVGLAEAGRDQAVLAKARRVTLLVGAIFLMSIADLVITLTYMRSVGMVEMNPIARYMISIGSIDQLVRYKLFTVGLSCGVLYLLRRHPRAELGAWICTAVLVTLMLHWVRYNSTIVDYSNELHMLAQNNDNLGVFVHIPHTQ